jgi:hypothetical protein
MHASCRSFIFLVHFIAPNKVFSITRDLEKSDKPFKLLQLLRLFGEKREHILISLQLFGEM